jgi:hypothetical protein
LNDDPHRAIIMVRSGCSRGVVDAFPEENVPAARYPGRLQSHLPGKGRRLVKPFKA